MYDLLSLGQLNQKGSLTFKVLKNNLGLKEAKNLEKDIFTLPSFELKYINPKKHVDL